jgi:hypothetical protein
MDTATTEVVREMLRLADEGQNPSLRPAILLNYNLNPLKIAECTSCHVNGSWAPKIKEMIDDGWVIFRMQTEFGVNGHYTMAYFAKLKTE